MQLFYCSNIIGKKSLLSPEESVHAIRVLRLKTGDKVQIIDGKGGLFEAVITLPDHRQCHLEITATLPVPNPRNFNLHIAIAPTKSLDRFEWFIEKAVEIGIDTITPLLCQRSERRVLKTERLHKLIISTMKQAIVYKLPILHELVDFEKFLVGFSSPATNRFIAHCNDSERKPLKREIRLHEDITILIGPEGDFSPEEVRLATTRYFVPVSLGNARLRTETAGIVACNTVSFAH